MTVVSEFTVDVSDNFSRGEVTFFFRNEENSKEEVVKFRSSRSAIFLHARTDFSEYKTSIWIRTEFFKKRKHLVFAFFQGGSLRKLYACGNRFHVFCWEEFVYHVAQRKERIGEYGKHNERCQNEATLFFGSKHFFNEVLVPMCKWIETYQSLIGEFVEATKEYAVVRFFVLMNTFSECLEECKDQKENTDRDDKGRPFPRTGRHKRKERNDTGDENKSHKEENDSMWEVASQECRHERSDNKQSNSC